MTSVFQTLSIYHYARNCRGKALRYKELSSKRKMRKQMHNWMQCSRHCDRRVCKFLLCEFVAVRFRSCFVLETEMFPLVCMVHSWAICVHWLSFGNFMLSSTTSIFITLSCGWRCGKLSWIFTIPWAFSENVFSINFCCHFFFYLLRF